MLIHMHSLGVNKLYKTSTAAAAAAPTYYYYYYYYYYLTCFSYWHLY